MTSARLGLAALPVVTFLLTLHSVRPVAPVTGSLRLAVARAAVLTGAFGVVSIEVLSAVGWLTAVGVSATWVVALVAAGAAAWWRRRRGDDDWRRPALSGGELVLAVAVLVLVLLELVLALASPPNTYDSQTY